MKRFLSVALSAALLCGGLAVTGVSAEDTAKVRPTVTLAESGFEDGLKAPFIINDGQAVGTQVSLEGEVNGYMHVTERKNTGDGNTLGATPKQSIVDIMKENGANGRYYFAAKFKLDNPEDTAYVVPHIWTDKGLQLSGLADGPRYEVKGSDGWVEVGQKNGVYYPLATLAGTFNDDTLKAMTRAVFNARLYANKADNDRVPYDGAYSMDDVVVWFVPEATNTTRPAEIGETILKDADFEAHIGDPTYYQNKTDETTADSWFFEKAAGKIVCTPTIEKEGNAVGTEFVHSGKGSLHVTNRGESNQGIQVEMKDIAAQVGPLSAGEYYSMSVWMRAEDGEEFTVTPIFGSNDAGTGMVLGGEPITITDKWTQVGIKTDGTYSAFTVEGGTTIFDPSQASVWTSLWLRTSDTKSYYIDDFKVFGPQKPGDAVEGFVNGVNALPAPADITRANGAAIETLEKAYEELAGLTLTDDQKAAIKTAKEKLDAARAAYDALPPEKNAFVPEFKYENKANLIAPYGDLESFTANDYIWSEADVEGGHPKYTLITDKNIAHGGNNCLLISDRTSKYNAAAFTLTEVIKSQGGGKYYFSAWLRTKNPGDVMTVTPQLYISALGDPAGVYEAEPVEITNEWTFVGVAYDDLDGYLQYQGNEIPEYTQGYISLRFRGQNELWESDADGAAFPDYYIDDLKFWKAFDGQEDYEDPDNPKPAPTPSEPGDNSSTGGDNSSTSGDNGNPSNPTTGHSLPLALPVLGVLALGGVLLTRKRK
jgi:carbohydrate binding domain